MFSYSACQWGLQFTTKHAFQGKPLIETFNKGSGCFVFINLTGARESREEGASAETLPPQRACLSGILLMMEVGRPGAHCKWCHPWAYGPELNKKGSRASHGEQASEQYSSVVSASFPASRFLICAPALASLADGMLPGNVTGNKPFLPQVAFSHAVSTATGKADKICST